MLANALVVIALPGIALVVIALLLIALLVIALVVIALLLIAALVVIALVVIALRLIALVVTALVVTALVIIALVVITTALQAQTAPPRQSEVIEVTATKIAEDVTLVPQSITVIDGDAIRARGANDLTSALSLTAGVSISPGGDAAR